MNATLLKERAQSAAARLANADSPLIRNAWYVAAMSSEVGRELLERTLLERSVVLFRKQDGTAVAMQNRCAHRSFPLSNSSLEGDRLVCGYHGFAYEADGRCSHVPSQDIEPRNICVKSYPVIERGSFVWIWMGAPDEADPCLLPNFEWMVSDAWKRSFIYMKLAGSYVHLHENILDLSHLSYLHMGSSFGTKEHATTRPVVSINDRQIEIWRDVECRLPPMLGEPLGWAGQRGIRRSGTEWISPAMVMNTVELTNLEFPEQNPPSVPTGKIAHLITPETRTSLHYFVTFNRNYVPDAEGVTEFIRNAQYKALQEDAFAMQRIQEVASVDSDPDFFEVDVAADQAGIAMRKRLKQLIDLEQGMERA
jgi:vanillate O-demethylase monooxygenase subunit